MLNVLQVETTNICQAKCKFCPHSKIKDFGIMDDGLYSKILKEASKLPPLYKFIPVINGEPFLDKKIVERIELAREMLPPITGIEIYTNGSFLTKEIIGRFSRIDNFHIVISLNSISQETRKKNMGLDDYEQVEAMVKYAAERGLSYTVSSLKEPYMSEIDLKKFYVKWVTETAKKPDWIGSLSTLNFAGLMFDYERGNEHPCGRAMEYMTVMWDGRVSLCCMDALGKVIFGDLNKQSILEVWNSYDRQRYVQLHKEQKITELELCKNCNCADAEFCQGCSK